MLSYQVLIVDHAPIISTGLQNQLRRWGFQHISVATNGPDALTAAGQQRPDMVIINAALPGPFDGLETARLLQEQEPPVTVLLLQNRHHAGAQPPHPEPLGRYHCLPHPPSVEELQAGIINFLQRVPAKA